jgi:ABC-2 type transport system ATP-binding protein
LDAKEIQGGRTAYQHLRWVAQASRIPRRRVDEVLEIVGLTDVAHRRVGGFSLGMFQRLGIATAVLGDPPVLLFDEPVNGLDPEGIVWIRTLMQRLASEGRTVFVSSHLMNEMQETAEHVLVIGRGRLIADTSVADLMRNSARSHVRVVSPQAAELSLLLEGAGGRVDASRDGALSVAGLDASMIGDIAYGGSIRLHELTPQHSSLEAVFMELTRDSVEYHADAVAPSELATKRSRT